MSADGSAFHNALVVTTAGAVSFPNTSFDALAGITGATAALTGLIGLSYVTDSRASGAPGNITLALSDAGKLLYHPAADTTPRTVTIDTNAHVAFGDTATIPFFAAIGAGALVFTPASGVTLIMGGASVATATAAAGYSGRLMHITGDIWQIAGEALS